MDQKLLLRIKRQQSEAGFSNGTKPVRRHSLHAAPKFRLRHSDMVGNVDTRDSTQAREAPNTHPRLAKHRVQLLFRSLVDAVDAVDASMYADF